MICKECANRRHGSCFDVEHGTDYRGCFCQHSPEGSAVNPDWLKLIDPETKRRVDLT